MTDTEIAQAFTEYGKIMATEAAAAAAVPGPRRRHEGTMALAGAMWTLLGPICPELRKPMGRVVMEVVAEKLGEMFGETWTRAYTLGKSVAADIASGVKP